MQMLASYRLEIFETKRRGHLRSLRRRKGIQAQRHRRSRRHQ